MILGRRENPATIQGKKRHIPTLSALCATGGTALRQRAERGEDSPRRGGCSTALRISHPALVSYLIQVYEVLWAQAVPLAENHQATAPNAPVTAVQHSIARLLAEGHVDEVVARKMGISVRTCRSHIAKLMQTLGATSRTHLGALLVESGIVETTAAEQPLRTDSVPPDHRN
ncbi:hypothetical protein SMICM17S_06961 [Streptomyces microflavus]